VTDDDDDDDDDDDSDTPQWTLVPVRRSISYRHKRAMCMW